MSRWLLLDPVAIVAFAAFGRQAHRLDPAPIGALETAAPFLIAMAVGWMVARAWRRPTGVGAGITVLIVTVSLGMFLRNVGFGEGTAPAFIAVSIGFWGMTMLGWRGVVGRLVSEQPASGK